MKFTDYLLIKKNGQFFLLITDIPSTAKLEHILSLVMKMIFVGESHDSISFNLLDILYSVNNQYIQEKKRKLTFPININRYNLKTAS